MDVNRGIQKVRVEPATRSAVATCKCCNQIGKKSGFLNHWINSQAIHVGIGFRATGVVRTSREKMCSCGESNIHSTDIEQLTDVVYWECIDLFGSLLHTPKS